MNYILSKITKKEIEEADAFVQKRCKDSGLYKNRGGFKSEDILIGALAEIGVYKVLKKAGYDVSKPDFGIYAARNKTFNADLSDGERFWHVKGQSFRSASKYGASWIMQKSDPTIKVPELRHYLVPCIVDVEKKAVYIYAHVPVMTLVKNDLFGELKISYLNKTKIAIYLKDITRNLQTTQRWSILYNEVKNV